MKKLLYVMIVAAGAMASCEKTTADAGGDEANQKKYPGQTNYLIRKGNHYCDQSLVTFTSNATLKATVTFDSSAMYTSLNEGNQGDINKLLGFSDCGSDHQQNSARLGWSWNGQHVVIYAYSYVNKLRVSKTLGTVNLYEPFDCSVTAVGNYYQFTAAAYADSIPRHCPDYKGTRYKLYPYFGGDEVAPHDVRIVIAEQ